MVDTETALKSNNTTNADCTREKETIIKLVKMIWASKKPLSRDLEATTLFLRLRQELFKTQRCLRPNSANAAMMEVIKEQHAESRNERKEEFSVLSNLMEMQNQQREKLQNLFEKLVDKEIGRKKKGLIKNQSQTRNSRNMYPATLMYPLFSW
ncbi:unnamed protein product [Ceutorhynchus assimilis]|uniref:Uncharacterized protein n=1 Tax=Ceutorhynchus assimilis TaxID=467358 RepID=A0A9N9MLA7_9CUCU|nr:unnamed protein product [Ceutorhynchus assimilis]